MVVGASTERAPLVDGCFVGDRVWASDLYDYSEPARLHPGTIVAPAANRAAKFALFKPAEEMVYIALDNESRTKGKAEADT